VVWVDYNYTGSTQNGSYDAPYKTLASGVAAVASGGNIWFKTSGSSTETLTITKAMNVNSAGGSVTVGN
ncbi:MAG TPA: hypothetical protein VN829_18935, partial [Dongiaceae bacterium]|nr:hypothetical protein [Dongiaceae bacterium]